MLGGFLEGEGGSGCTCGMQKVWGQGSNPGYSGANSGPLTCCATRKHQHFFISEKNP